MTKKICQECFDVESVMVYYSLRLLTAGVFLLRHLQAVNASVPLSTLASLVCEPASLVPMGWQYRLSPSLPLSSNFYELSVQLRGQSMLAASLSTLDTSKLSIGKMPNASVFVVNPARKGRE